jgi:NAD(P)H-hydrate epimerase
MTTATRSAPIPCVTADQMREVDRIATEEYGLDLLQMMENAGRHLASLARERVLEGELRDATVLVLCGTGGNGGGGLVAARRLHNWGATVRVCTTRSPDAYSGVPAHQLALLRPLTVDVTQADPDALPDADLLLDAIIGYGLDGDLRDDVAALIRAVIWHGAPALSLDVPSGLNATTGVPSETTVHAEATLTLALPKCGLDAPAAESSVGDLFLADIGIPPSLYDRLDVASDVTGLFARQDLIQVR